MQNQHWQAASGAARMVNAQQTYFIVTLSCYILSAGLLWRSWIMKPFKLWTTFMHEFSHACAAWLSCHEVTGIEVHADEGGLTHWKGRNVECAKHIVLPAGYLGSTIWGSLTLLSCSDGLWMRVMGCALCAALAVCLSYACCGQTKDPSDKWPLVGICVGFGIVLGTLTVFSFLGIWSGAETFLEALLLWVGTLNLLYATIDVYECATILGTLHMPAPPPCPGSRAAIPRLDVSPCLARRHPPPRSASLRKLRLCLSSPATACIPAIHLPAPPLPPACSPPVTFLLLFAGLTQ